MNPFAYHHTIPPQPTYTYGVPLPAARVAPVRFLQFLDNVVILDAPNTLPVHQGRPMPSYYTQNHSYMPYARPETTFDRFDAYAHEFEAYLEERLMMVELERQLNPGTSNSGLSEETLLIEELEQQLNPSTSGSGLSEEDISERLHVYTAQGKGKMIKDCEADTCSICLGDCSKNERIGRLECGHQYHAVCIKGWLLSKNTCPMCRSVALRV